MLTQSNIDMMFKLYDKDGNGEIDCTEFIEGMKTIQALEGGQDGKEVWSQIISEVDKNADGQISQQEFKEALNNVL